MREVTFAMNAMDLNTLYRKACADDPAAERELFQYLIARFQLFARQRIRRKEDQEEVVQSALTAIWERFRVVEFETGFAAWAQKIFEHKVIDYYRSESFRQRKFTDLPDGDRSVGMSSPDPILKKALIDCLKKVNAANRRHGRILVLRYQGYAFDEICARLNLKANNAYSVLSRARTMLERCLKTGDIKK